MLRWPTLWRGPRTIVTPTGQKMTQIPIIGNSGITPTGALQFRDDWPGLFIHGDQAAAVAGTMRTLRERLANHPDHVVKHSLRFLEEYADMISRHVSVSRAEADGIPDW